MDTTTDNNYTLYDVTPDNSISGVLTPSAYTRTQRQPFELYNRFSTLEQLTKYVQLSKKNSGNAYNGQIVSVYKDTNTENNGIYYISDLTIDKTADGNVTNYALNKVSGGTDSLKIATENDILDIFNTSEAPEGTE